MQSQVNLIKLAELPTNNIIFYISYILYIIVTATGLEPRTT